MDALSLLIVKILLALTLSLLVIGYLRRALGALLLKACPDEATLFWIRTIELLLLLAPLLIVLLFSSPEVINPVRELQRTLLYSLIGLMGGIAILARQVWNLLVIPNLPAAGLINDAAGAQPPVGGAQ